MPQAVTAKSDASADERLAYLEQLSQTMMGLQSANQALIARRAIAGSDETRRIDIQVSVNNSDWAKASAAMTLYFTEDVQFKPPTPDELQTIEAVVKSLDGLIAAATRVDAVIASTTKLVKAFNTSQA
jgi:hypothetical protein